MSKRKRVSEKGLEALSIVSKTGIVPVSNIRELGLYEKTFKTLEKDNLLERTTVLCKNENNKLCSKDCYILTSKGSKVSNYHFDYVYNTSAHRHNIELNNYYKDLSKEEQNTWITEKQIYKLLENHIDQMEPSEERTNLYCRLLNKIYLLFLKSQIVLFDLNQNFWQKAKEGNLVRQNLYIY